MSQAAYRQGSFDNRGAGTQNNQLGDGSQNNNNSSGGQYNFTAESVYINHRQEQEQAQASIDDDILRSLAFPQMWDRREHVEPCYQNTCRWILELEHYKTWRSQSHGLLWIKGKPGAGKSTLMAFLHDELRKSPEASQGLRLEFFFTARGTELQRTPLGMLRSLLSQILKANATVCSELREAYIQRCRDFGYGEDKWMWTRVLLEGLLQTTILRLATQQQVTIFVDALDEAGEESARKLAGYFHQLNDQATQKAAMLKICISCRHYPIVANSGTTEIIVEAHNRDDITTYIKGHLSADIVVTDGPNEAGWKDLMNILIEQASGVFQWAHIVMPLIRGKIDDGRSPEDIRRWLPNVPTGLEDVYQYILEHVIKPEDRAESFQFFQWIGLTERPLTVTEMRYALAAHTIEATGSSVRWQEVDRFIATDERMYRLTKTLSGGLAEVIKGQDSGEIVQVVHQSVNEFLRTKGLVSLSRLIGSVTLPVQNRMIMLQCQAMLYQSCLVYIATAEIPCESLPDKRDKRRKALIRNVPFLSYATVNLLVHAEKAAEYRSFGLAKEIQILQKVVARWVEFYEHFYRLEDVCPPAGTTVLHMAAAANMADAAASLASDSENVIRVDRSGDTPFHSAARWGHVEVGEILLEKGAKLDMPGRSVETALVSAASRGHVGFVEWLLQKGASIGTIKGSSGGALQAASLEGRGTTVRILLDAKADVNAQGGQYGNALYAASYNGSAEVVQMLLDAKADVNAQGGQYGNALQAASWQGGAEVVQMLLDAKANVNAQGGHYGNALQAASFSWRASTEKVKMLLDANADVNAQGGEYGNALQAASYDGSAEVVKMLLDAKADVNAQGGQYGNALQAASFSWRASTEKVKMLLDANADVNAQGGEYSNALQTASWHGSAEVVQMLLDAKADVNAQGGHLGNALQAASCNGSAEVVKILLDAKADVNAQGGHLGNALQAASCNGSAEVVKILLDAKADVNAQGGHLGNALQAASCKGSAEVVKMLLDAKADVNAQGGEYGNALQAASCNGSAEVVQMLLDAKANANAQGGEYGNALQAASYDGSAEVVKMLLDAKADVNAQGGHLGNALQAASCNGSAEVVKILLDAKADVNAQGGHLGNALQAASCKGSAEVVKMLLDAKADVNAQGGEYGNALQAASCNGSAEVVQMLLDAKANANAQGGEYGNALQAASYDGSAEVVKMLLDAKADVNAQGGQYGNALQAASWQGGAEVVQMLLDAKADVNAQGGHLGNALQAASCNGSAEVVQMLLDAKADVNAQGGEYGNALQAASWQGGAEVVQMLLDANADVNAQGGEYGNALQAASYKGRAEVVQILLQAGANPNLLDSLHRSPLHIAATKDFLPLLRQFPRLSSTINAPDIFLQTPLHLAVSHGHIHFALALLELGANPLIRDGYGMNTLDWAVDYLLLSTRIQHLFPKIAQTHHEVQLATVRRSIHQLSNTLYCSAADPSTPLRPLLQQLGHYLLFLNDVDNARSIFQLNFSQGHVQIDVKYDLACDLCDERIHGTLVVCRLCVNQDFCLSCSHKYPTHGRPNFYQAHDVLEVAYEHPSDSQPTMERLNDLLQQFALQFGDTSALGNSTMTITNLSAKSLIHSPTPAGSQSSVNYWLAGLLVTSLCTCYFYHRK